MHIELLHIVKLFKQELEKKKILFYFTSRKKSANSIISRTEICWVDFLTFAKQSMKEKW